MGFGLFSALKVPDSFGGNTMIYQYINLGAGIINTGILAYMYMAMKYVCDFIDTLQAGMGSVVLNQFLMVIIRFFFTETFPSYLNFFYLRGIA